MGLDFGNLMAEAHRCIIGTNNKLINLDSLINVESVRSELSRHSCGARREEVSTWQRFTNSKEGTKVLFCLVL